jgi:hypothetical protein
MAKDGEEMLYFSMKNDIHLNPKFIQAMKHIFFPSLCLMSLYLSSLYLSPKDVIAADTKPYNDFTSFYPFYLTQHVNPYCQLLHAVGTFIVVTIALLNPAVIYGLFSAIMIGLTVQPLTRQISHGFIEMAGCMLGYQLGVRYCKGSKLTYVTPLFAYALAWIGHYIFELNKPATFIYPTYSLLGDFRMFGEYVMSNFYSKDL